MQKNKNKHYGFNVPRSQSQYFPPKKQQPRPQNQQPKEEKPAPKIKIERVQKPAQQLTPFDIQRSYVPTQSVKIDAAKKTSFSITINGEERTLMSSSKSTIALSDLANTSPTVTPSISMEFPIKDIYTVEDLQMMRPSTYTTKLTSPGFIMLLHLKGVNGNAPPPHGQQRKQKRNQPKRQNSKREAELLSHDHNRFIGTNAIKAVGLFDEQSHEAIRSSAQRILNRINSRNLRSSIDAMRNLNISNQELINLLLDRATMDTEFPERNVQLTNFLNFTIDYSMRVPTFGPMILNSSYDAAYGLIGNSKQVPIASFQCMAVWLSALFNAGMGEEHQLYAFFDRVLKDEPKERAIDVLRCGLYICGKRVGPNFEIFFDFLASNPSQYGHKRFLVEDLFLLREHHWDRRALEPRSAQQGLRIEFGKKQEEAKEDPHDVDNADNLDSDYRRWLNEEDFNFMRLPADTLIRLTLRQLPKHIKDVNAYVQYAAAVLAQTDDSEKADELIKQHFDVFAEHVRVEENPHLWTVFFMLVASYYAEKLIPFECIKQLILKSTEHEQSPRLKNVVFRMSEITGVPIDEAIVLMEAVGEPSVSDPEFVQAIVALSELEISESEELEIAKRSSIHAGVIVRELTASALQEDVQDPTTIFDKKKDLMRSLYLMYGRTMINVAKHVFNAYQLPEPRKRELNEYLEHTIFDTEE